MLDSARDEGLKPTVFAKEGRTFQFPINFQHDEVVDGQKFILNFRFVYPDCSKEYVWQSDEFISIQNNDIEHNTLVRQSLSNAPYVSGVMSDMNIDNNGALNIGMTFSFVDDHEILFGAMIRDGLNSHALKNITQGITVPGFTKTKTQLFVELDKKTAGYAVLAAGNRQEAPYGYDKHMTHVIRAVHGVLLDDLDGLVGGPFYGREGYSKVKWIEGNIKDYMTGQKRIPPKKSYEES